MNLKYIYIFLIIILLLPLNFAELQPAFLDQNTHYLGEKINFGLIGIIPEDLNYVAFSVLLPEGYGYQEGNLQLDNLSDYYIIFPLNFIHSQLQIKYIYYNSNNTEISNQEYTLQLTKLLVLDNINYCVNSDCNDTHFELIDTNEISITTQTTVADENLSFNIKVILDDDYVIEEIKDIQFPYFLENIPGEYEIRITPNYNEQEFETKSLFVNISEISEESNDLEEYLTDIKENSQTEEIKPTNAQEYVSLEEKKDIKKFKPNSLLIGGILLAVIIFISILLFSGPKTNKSIANKQNRRESRTERGFLFVVVLLFVFSSVHALTLEEKQREYKNLEISFDTFQKDYPYPANISVPISNTQPHNIFYYPISATGLSENEKITPVVENNLENLNVSLESVYLSINLSAEIEKAKSKGESLGFEFGCEQVLEWFQENPINAEPNSIIARTKENLLKNITILENKTGYTDADKTQIQKKIKELKTNKKYKNSKNPFVEYCISEYLSGKESIIGGKYLTEKKNLLKVEYTEKNQEAINNYELTSDNIIFNNSKNKDVLDTSFLGSDLNHIYVWVDYTADILKEQNLSIKGVAADRILKEDVSVDGEIIKHYAITNLDEGESIDISYVAQLVNLEILDSDYGSYYQFEGVGQDTSATPEKKGNIYAIRDKDLFSIKNKILSNVEISGKIFLENGNYKFELSQESKKLLAEININPTKYLALDKKQLIDVGTDDQKLTLGIDYSYGIISSDFSEIAILLEDDKTVYLPTNINNPHLEILTKLFIKTSSQKNIELTRLQLPLLFIFAFKNNANKIKNEDVLFLKTYDDVANIINRANYTKLEKNIIFNNLISLTEDFSFQKTVNSKDGLYKFQHKTRLVLNYGLLNYIDHPENIARLNPENIGVTIPQLYDNDYLERKGFVDKELTTLLVLGYLGDNYSSFSKGNVTARYSSHEEYENDLKNQIKIIFSEQNATSENWGYYKQLLAYPFYRTGFEQKICSYDKENFPKYSVKNYCYQAYNFDPDADTWGIAYNPYNLNSGFLMQDNSFQNNFVSAYRTILLLEDIDSFKNNKLVFNQNQLKTYNKLNTFLSLIELEAIRHPSTTENSRNFGNALILSYKLRELWDSSSNELKKYDSSGTIGKAIINTNETLAYQAAVKLRNTISTDRSLRLDVYKGLIQTDFDRYTESINPSAKWFDLGDSARFLITGSWIETFIFTGSKKDIENLEKAERDKYNKILHGSCCITQRLGELGESSSYKNWTIKDVKDNLSPYSKIKTITKSDVISWTTDGTGCTGTLRANPGDCAVDISNLYKSEEYGGDISFILNDKKDKKSITQLLSAGYYINHTLDMDNSRQINFTKRELEETKVKFKPGFITSALRFVDSGINPATIILTVATAGVGYGLTTGTGGFFTRVASGFTAKVTLGKLSSSLGTRILYELGENVVLDTAYGIIVVPSPKLAGEHPFMTYMLLGIVSGNFQKAFISNIDNAASAITKDLITTSGLKQADNLKIQNAIKTALNTDYADTTEQLLKLKRGELVTDEFFRRLPKIAAGTVDDEIINSIRKNLLSQKISVSEDIIKRSLTKNKLYLGTRASAVSKFISSKNLIEVNNITAANLDNTSSKFIKLVTTRTVPERYGAKFTSIVDEFEDLKKFNEIDPEHFAKPTKIVYDDFGNPLGYEMEKISGVTLADYIEDGATLDDSFYKRIEDSVDELHKQGYAHGDINPTNIIIRETYDGLDFTIIDPVGFRKIVNNTNLNKNLNTIISDDITNIQNLKNYTTSDKLKFNTNTETNYNKAIKLKEFEEYVPIRRTGGGITYAKITDVKDWDEAKRLYPNELNAPTPHQSKIKLARANFIEYDQSTGNPIEKVKWVDLDTGIVNYDSIRNSDLIFNPQTQKSGIILEINSEGIATIADDSQIYYVKADEIISWRNHYSAVNTSSVIEPNFSKRLFNNEKFPSEFAYPGSSGWNSREIIYVNKDTDPILKNFLQQAQEISRLHPDPNTKIYKAYNHVISHFTSNENSYITIGGIPGAEDMINGTAIPKGTIIPLGYFITNKVGVCRHRALALKLTLDEMGINSNLVRGIYDDGRGLKGRHIWIEIPDPQTGRIHYLDPTLNLEEWFYPNQRPSYLQLSDDLSFSYYTRKPIQNYNAPKINQISNLQQTIKNVYIPDKSSITDVVKQFNDAGYAVSENEIKTLIKEQANIVTKLSQDPVLSTIKYNIDAVGGIFSPTITTHELKNSIITELYKNNVILEIVDDGVVQRATGDVKIIQNADGTFSEILNKNYATVFYDTQTGAPTIQIERSATESAGAFLREIRHEYGAILLIKQYGSKVDIPKALIITNGIIDNDNWMTHYLDHVYDGWAKEGLLIN